MDGKETKREQGMIERILKWNKGRWKGNGMRTRAEGKADVK